MSPFTSSPPEIGDLTALGKLDVSHNMLTELPWELHQLTGTIRVVDVLLSSPSLFPHFQVQYNPLVIPPRPIVDKGTGAILEWLKKNEEKVSPPPPPRAFSHL